MSAGGRLPEIEQGTDEPGAGWVEKLKYIFMALVLMFIRLLILLLGGRESWYRSLKQDTPLIGPNTATIMAIGVNLIAVWGLFLTKGETIRVVGSLFIIGLLLGMLIDLIFYVGHDLEMTVIMLSFSFLYQIAYIKLLLRLRLLMAIFLLPRLAYTAVELFSKTRILALNTPGYNPADGGIKAPNKTYW